MPLTGVGYDWVIRPLLASPQFREQHARQLLEMLVKHEKASINAYEEGIKFEFVAVRLIMNSTVKDPRGAIAGILAMYKANGKAFVDENNRAFGTGKLRSRKWHPPRSTQ